MDSLDGAAASVVWRGNEYAPLHEWSTGARNLAWGAASEDERERWAMAVGDLCRAYCVLREFERGTLKCEAHLLAKIANGTASFTAVRRAARQHAKQSSMDRGAYARWLADVIRS